MKYIFLFFITNIFQLQAQSYLDYYFKANQVIGAIVIYDQNKEQWLFSTESEVFINSPIASHFHLWQALIGLENNIFKSDVHEVQLWDGVKRTFFGESKPEWNQSSNLIDALKNKNDWYFDLLKNQLPKDYYQENIANAPILKEIRNNEWSYFWNYGALTNPNTMILFLKDMYEGKLPFNKAYQQLIFNQLLIDKDLAINTGTTHYNGQKIEWTIGVYFKQKEPIYFSLRTINSLDKENEADYEKRRNLVLSQIFETLNY
nr:hypothetical protein [uncultured Flavobacterium sp.]